MIESPEDTTLLQAFEDGSLPVEQWTHRAHVRVAYLCLSKGAPETAVAWMRSSLKAYNARHGVPDEPHRGYHETITQAFMRLIGDRMKRRRDYPNSEAFCDANGDLLDRRTLLRFYSRGRIMSAEAKQNFLEPDLAPLPPPE